MSLSPLSLHAAWLSAAVLAGGLVTDLSAAVGKSRSVLIAQLSQPSVFSPLGTSLRPAEQAFLERARDAIRQNRRLSELGVTLATRPEVRAHVQRVAADFRQLADDFDGLVRKKGIALAVAPDVPAEAYASLTDKSGPEFDRALLAALGELHASTSQLFEQATSDAKDPDVRDFAAAQLPMLREHRNRIVQLRQAYE